MRLLLILILVGVVTACAPITAPSSQPIAADNPEDTVPDVPVMSPQEVIAKFLDAWNIEDYDTMYSLVHPTSQQQYLIESFRDRYTLVHQRTGFSGISYNVNEITQQGTTSIIDYDVTINSSMFSPIPDSGRTMRLVKQDASWLIAWSPLDILDGLSPGARIEIEGRFPTRGNIYDRNGRPMVESNGRIISLWAQQQDMSDYDGCIDVLARMTRRQRGAVAREFVPYAPETYFQVTEVDPDTFSRYQNDLRSRCGIYDNGGNLPRVVPYTSRSYIGHGSAAHVTGYIGRVPGDQIDYWRTLGYPDGAIVGLAGLENAYEAQLAGSPQRFLRITEPGGYIIRELQSAEGSPSTSIITTIDMGLQNMLAQTFSDAFNYAQIHWASVAAGAGAVIMNPNTGEVLAMASYPSYDPSLFNPETSYQQPLEKIRALYDDPRAVFKNKAYSEQYSPASTYKIITIAAAATESIWGIDELFYCDLSWDGTRFNDVRTVRYDWRFSHGYDPAGNITMVEALASSCDPFFYEMGALLFQKNPNLLVHYSELFGLGKRTGIKLAEPEAPGNLADPRTAGNAINNAIGQGDVSVTALQMASVVATVANGGTVYKPYLVQQVGGTDGQPVVESREPEILTEEAAPPGVIEVIQRGLCSVTTDRNYGTAQEVFEGTPYTLCGKTGTAEAGFAPHAWFVAYSPAENPQIAIAVVVPNSREGSEVAAPIVRRVLDMYYSVPWKDFPEEWTEEYEPVEVPAGGVAGG